MRRTTISGYCLFICLIVLIIISGCAEESEDSDRAMLAPADLLPDDYDISAWRKLNIYDEANDFDGLHDFIGSEAGMFVDEGFASAVFQWYEECINDVCSLVKIHLSVYDQGDSENAMAVYERVDKGVSVPWDGAGTEARIDESKLEEYVVEFWQRNFFIQVGIEEKSDKSLNVAKLFASHISSGIE